VRSPCVRCSPGKRIERSPSPTVDAIQRGKSFHNANPTEELLAEPADIQVDVSFSHSPFVQAKILNCTFLALIDSGSDVSCISDTVFRQLEPFLKEVPVLPVQGIRVKGPFKARAWKVSHQLLLPIHLGAAACSCEFVVIPGLEFSVILGADFLRANDVQVRVNQGKFSVSFLQQGKLFTLPEVSRPSQRSRVAQLHLCRIAPALADPPRPTRAEFNLPPDLPEHHSHPLLKLLEKHQHIFSDSPGLTNNYHHEIRLTSSEPFAVRQYPIPLAHREKVQEEVNRMERWGVISRSDTPYSSPLVTTVKKDGSVRICLDARRLNSMTEADTELPRSIDDLLHSLGQVKFFSSLDLTASYWQIPIKPEHRRYTGFRVGTRAYHFNVLPFGLKTAVSSFTRCMDAVLGPLAGKIVHPYIDDLLVVSSSFEEHLDHLEQVFTRLSAAGFTLRAEKCTFLQKSASFLGFVLDQEGIRPDPERVQGLIDFPTPSHVKQLQAFLGLANFDRGFVPKFATISEPLTQLLRKGQPWIWQDSQDSAFHAIKQLVADSALLRHPDPRLPFAVECDASDVGIGAVLFQVDGEERRVIAYASKSLLERERKYTTTERELLAIVFALQKWRVFLIGRHFHVFTDHHCLQYMQRCRLLSPRITRWVLLLQEYDFSIKYLPGVQNHLADILSRFTTARWSSPAGGVFTVASMARASPAKKLFAELKTQQKSDPLLSVVLADLEADQEKPNFCLVNGLVCRQVESCLSPLPCVPKALVVQFVQFYHEYYGHFGVYKTWQALRRDVWFNRMHDQVKQVLRGCQLCQTAKHARLSTPPFESILPDGPNDLVAVDYFGPLPRSIGGVMYILVVLDVFSKWVALYPVKRATASVSVKKLKEDYFLRVGKPRRVLSDHGTQFTSKRWHDFLREEEVQMIFSSVRHPQGNPSERVMRELGRLFRTYRREKHTGWAKDIPSFQFFLNNVVHQSTGFSPTELHFGKMPLSPRQDAGIPPPELQQDSTVRLFLAQERLRKSSRARLHSAKTKFSTPNFTMGDLVLLRANPIPQDPLRESKKFLPLFEGPFRLKKQVGSNTFVLEEPNSMKERGTFHCSLLRPFFAPPVPVTLAADAGGAVVT
jgi:transposase InsO family protein